MTCSVHRTVQLFINVLDASTEQGKLRLQRSDTVQDGVDTDVPRFLILHCSTAPIDVKSAALWKDSRCRVAADFIGHLSEVGVRGQGLTRERRPLLPKQVVQ